MPIHQVPGGWQWGNQGKVYPTRAGAARQAAAAYAHGYHEPLSEMAGVKKKRRRKPRA